MGDDQGLSDQAQEAWRSYMTMQQRLGRHLTRHLQQEFGLSDSDFEILVNLSEAAQQRMRAFELGQATQWEKSRLSHHLARMERRGLICREAGDARYPDIVLTEKGLDAIKAAAPANAARVQKLFVEVFGPDRLAMLRDASNEVIAAIDHHMKTDCPPEVLGI